MAQSLNVKIAGLYSFPSDLSAVPPGALTEASNIILDQDSIAAPRRGFDYLAHGSSAQSQFSNPTYRSSKLFFYQGYTLAHYGTPGSPTLLAYHDSTTGWTNYTGTFSSPSSSTTVKSAQYGKNFYFTTSTGVQKLSTPTGTPTSIGCPPGLDLVVTLASTNPTPTANTSSSVNPTVLTSVSSITGLAIGLVATGTGIPANTIVTSFTATTVTLSQACTATNTGVTVTFTPASTWLSGSTSPNALQTTGYRVVWTLTDANQNLIIGAPSAFAQVTNYTTTSALSVNVNFSIPASVTTSHVYQIYRSAAVAAGVTPSDEEQLVYQGSCVAADLAANGGLGTITVNDVVPDALRSTTIYTAPSQQGLVNQNGTPPLANDLAVFRDCMFYGYTSGLQTYSLNLLGVGVPTGVASGDTLTVGSETFTADTSENTATGHFLVTSAFSLSTTGSTNTNAHLTGLSSTSGVTIGMTVTGAGVPTGTYVTALVSSSAVDISQAATASASVTITFNGDSAAQAIRDTALSLVRVINRFSTKVYASYISTLTGLPGMMVITSRTVGAASFAVTSTKATCWSPSLPSSGTTQSSTNQINKNYLSYSKQFQPEHVPAGNFFPVGSADKAILRIVALRDSLFILKEDGTFLLTGTDPTNFLLRPLDYTSILIAPDTAVVLNNQIFCLTTQGVVALSEIGAPIMSHPIEGDLTALNSQNYSLLQTSSFGIAYESDRAYYLFVITNGADTGPTQYFRFNYITNSWTHGTLGKSCGGVNPVDNRLYLGNTSLPIVDVERKNLQYSDYADYASTQTISVVSGSGKVLTITGADSIAVGSIIFQSSTVFGTVIATDPIQGTVTTSLNSGLIAGTADVLAPIACTLSWAPLTLDNPGYVKQLREVALVFLAGFNGSATVGFSTDFYPGVETETLPGGQVGGWGLFAFGGPQGVIAGGAPNVLGANWGGSPQRGNIRASVTRNHQRCAILTVSFAHSFAYSPWKLQGISLIGNLVSERTS